jgi:hypothetical protein
MHLFQRLAVTLVAAVFSLLASYAMADDDISTRVIVPDAPGGALVAGCYRVPDRIYKSYHLSFCLQQRGTYEVTGGGVLCRGRLNWSGKGSTVSVRLQRTSCGNGKAWSADTMTCRPNGLFSGVLPRVIVPNLPNLPSLGGLRCDYRPARGSGERPISFIARRAHY